MNSAWLGPPGLQLDLFSSGYLRFTDEVSDFKSDLSQLLSLQHKSKKGKTHKI